MACLPATSGPEQVPALVLLNPLLLERLRDLEGYRPWQPSGGALLLADRA